MNTARGYDRLLEALDTLGASLRADSTQPDAHALDTAREELVTLVSRLDFDRDAELAPRLAALYSYLIRALPQAAFQADLVALERMRGMLQNLRDAWAQVRSAAP